LAPQPESKLLDRWLTKVGTLRKDDESLAEAGTAGSCRGRWRDDGCIMEMGSVLLAASNWNSSKDADLTWRGTSRLFCCFMSATVGVRDRLKVVRSLCILAETRTVGMLLWLLSSCSPGEGERGRVMSTRSFCGGRTLRSPPDTWLTLATRLPPCHCLPSARSCSLSC